MPRVATTWQTVGPFFSIGFASLLRPEMAPPGTPGERIVIQGRVFDGDAEPVPDACLEFWQADSEGRYSSPEASLAASPNAFTGFGRVFTCDDGRFRFSTIKPGCVPAPDGAPQAPHILVSVLLRGLLTRLVTRIYFAGDPRTASDFVLTRVPAERRATLLAAPSAEDPALLEWNLRLQGSGETVFFELGAP